MVDRESRLEIAGRALARALRWLEGARRALEDGRWDDAVYSSQMAVEQSSKAVLLALGIEYPRRHDVSDLFAELGERGEVPGWFRERLGEMCRVIAELAGVRGLAAYGYEEGLDAEYFRDYAPRALEAAEAHVELCRRLLRELGARV
ncbi:hypothetical protein B6U99_01725 [Candidatus Geothermarchaeota archaeon ex4572_27]|nr:MAG: hypothetical protein B6U99_01725 [Candidatus Geothermarchaeota archaeon ex4572_27]